MMRNIDQSGGLCNGTRLIIDVLGKYYIGATIITGKNVGDKIIIPILNLIPSDPRLPFKFTGRQFPLTLCFAMTINKSQASRFLMSAYIFLNPYSLMDNYTSLCL
jgi:ATP-dependent DNA helicase PIF1